VAIPPSDKRQTIDTFQREKGGTSCQLRLPQLAVLLRAEGHVFSVFADEMTGRRRSDGAGDATVPEGVIASMVAPEGHAEGRRRIRRRGAGSGLLLTAAILAVGLGSVAAVCNVTKLCGDGVVHPNEECDDRNPADGDGCSSNCTVECGFECQGTWATCAADQSQNGFFDSSCRPVYGDGLRVTGEPCDDGNLLSGDGCLCQLASRTTAGRSPHLPSVSVYLGSPVW
jgi:cysteine-rich repeat protein